MARYVVKAAVTADVEIAIEAGSADEARVIFEGQLVMSAALSDKARSEYAVYDDSITDVERIRAEVE